MRSSLSPTLSLCALLLLGGCLGGCLEGCQNDPPATEEDAGGVPGVDAGTDPGVDAGPPIGPSEGCGGATLEAGVVARTITVDGMERDYLLSIPEGYDPSRPYSLVFAWHGLGDNASNFSRAWRFESVTDGGAIVAYPQGVDRSLGAAGWQLGRTGIDVAFFDALHQSLMAELCVEKSAVFSTGFSYGGFFSNSLGCYRGDLLRAIAPMSGGNLADRCRGQVAVTLIHGTADSVIDYEGFGLDARDAWLERNHCEATPASADEEGCEAYTCDVGYPVIMCTHGGDHTVPAYAASRIWGFFQSLP